jgi:hypothetical protein
MFGSGPVVFDQQLPVTLSTDAHIVAAAAGEGVQLGVVYGPMPIEGQSGYGSSGADMPCAVANPIFVDVDGNGFKPNGDLLDLPLPVQPGHRPSHGHDHENFHEHAVSEKQAARSD